MEDCQVMEGKTLKEFRELCEHADRAQERLLLELLAKNSGTEFGRAYNFSEIESVAEYQAHVPVTDYDDYEKQIARGIAGEQRLLLEEETAFYCISSGSTHLPKYLPVTKTDIMLQKRYLMDAVMETIQKETGIPESSLFEKIFETGEFFQTFMPDGTMNGVRSGVLHRWLKQDGQISWERYTAPKEVLFPEKLEDMLYIKLRFALACSSLTAIHGVFVHRLVGLFEYIAQNWQALLHDMEVGSVSDCFSVSDSWKEYLAEHLPPDPHRAAVLKAIRPDHMQDRLIRRIWPKLKYIRVVGGSIFASYMERLKQFTGDLPIHYYAYAASEGVFGISLSMDWQTTCQTLIPDDSMGWPDACYTLIPDECFFEFLPVNGGGELNTFSELEKGEKYELLITNRSGLYRYAMGDVVEIVDFYGKAPVVRICYRKNQIMDLADEKMNIRQMEAAIRTFEKASDCQTEGYFAEENLAELPPSYLICLELRSGTLPHDASSLLDQCLGESCFAYRSARGMGEIGPARAVLLKKGCFRAYEKFLVDSGYRVEQNKPLRILRTQEQMDFFKEYMEFTGGIV